MTAIESVKQYAERYTVLLVEDDAGFRNSTAALLAMIFGKTDIANNGREGLNRYRETKHDVVITDIDMPVMNGIEMIRGIRNISPFQPVIVISGHDEAAYLIELINHGIHHFIPKPFEMDVFLAVIEEVVRSKSLRELERDYQRQLEEAVTLKTRELSDSLRIIKELSEEIVLRLTTAAEYRDTCTGAHINRMGKYVEVLARAMELDEYFTESLKFAAPLHDIGKIGIPDQILLKPGPLTGEEWNVMRQHTVIGARILDNSKYQRVNTACSVAMNHHERWNGNGYPRGLKGDAIPLEGRVISVCDVYDALRSERPYKKPVGHGEACQRILEGDERTSPDHFDPGVLAAFRSVCGGIEEIYEQIRDVLV